MKMQRTEESVSALMNAGRETVCAAMVTYHPDKRVADRIGRWLEEVSVLYVIDNGSAPGSIRGIRHLAEQDRLVLMENGKNLGIGAAHNQAVQLACRNGYQWLLTLDQDSAPMPGYVGRQLKALSECPFAREVAGIGGLPVETHLQPAATAAYPPETTAQWRSVKIVISSGSLWRIGPLAELGGFRSDLFIDLVDTEYCLRLRRYGFRVIECGHARFYHHYGNTRPGRIGPFRIIKHVYPPVRNYYRFRNGVLLAGQYWRREPAWALYRIVRLGRLILNIILLHDRKTQNLKMAVKGIWHGLRGLTGPIENPGGRRKGVA